MVATENTNNIGNRYLLHDMIGEGGMGTVYRATDKLTGRDVALKRVLADLDLLDIDDSSRATNFRIAMAKEFKLSASLRHPNIITVLDYGFDREQQPFYTMELLPNAETILTASSNKSTEQHVTLLIQMLQALHYLHRCGIIHRDLKPANVLVVDDQVKVLDFGLSIMYERTQTDETDDATVGTLAYMAPEMLSGAYGTIQSDLYAVGMMAYEMLSGSHPFDLDNPAKLVNQMLLDRPVIEDLDVSLELGIIVERLLQKNASDRYNSAQDVINALAIIDETPNIHISEEIRESFLQAARFVGRDDELQQLSDSLEMAAQNSGSSWLIAGESGVGKSRIIDELRTLAMVKGAIVMAGQAVNIGSAPYHLWQPILRWLPLLDSHLTSDDIALLKYFAPYIERLSSTNEIILPVTGSPNELRSHLIDLLIAVFRRINRPIVILLEDLQWAGSESLQALRQLSENIAPVSVMVVGTFRDDELPDLGNQLAKMSLLKLKRLDMQGIRELSSAMLGETSNSNEVVDLLQRESEGNIFFIIEVIRALAEEVGNLEDVGRMTLPAQVFAGGIRTVMHRRLDRISDRSREILRYAAIMGRELQVDILQALMPHRNFESWLAECANAAVLEARETEWYFAHDKLRLGLLETLDKTELETLNREIATTIELTHVDNPRYYTALAHHWGNANDKDREEFYLTHSGKQALRTGAYQKAIKYLKRAQKLLNNLQITNDRRRDKQIWLRQQIANAHLGLGDYNTAKQIHQEALILSQQSDNQTAPAQSLEALGNIAIVQDEISDAQDCYIRSLHLYRAAEQQSDIARILNRLGDVAYEAGKADDAKRYYQESMTLSREIGKDWGMAGALRKLTQETTSVRDTNIPAGSSLEDIRANIQLAYEKNDRQSIASNLLEIARLLYDHKSVDKAVQILSYLLSDSEVEHIIQDEAEALIFDIEAVMPTYSIHAAWEHGKSLTLSNAVTIALES